MPVSLSQRLAVIAGMCDGAKRVIDVGCDHGKLVAALLQRDPKLTAIAADISPLSLGKASALVASLGLDDRCRCVCCDGLQGIDLLPGDCVVISGIGPDIISDIIERSLDRFPGDIRLVLSPASHHEKLRIYLAGRGFRPEKEYAVYEDGHFYAPGSYVRSENPTVLFPGASAAGIISPDYTDGRNYLETVLERYTRIAAAASDTAKKQNAEEIKTYLNNLLLS